VCCWSNPTGNIERYTSKRSTSCESAFHELERVEGLTAMIH
jgi:hypothetical protein